MADKLGVSRQTIIALEHNRYNPSLILAFEIALLFRKDINDVFQYVVDEDNGKWEWPLPLNIPFVISDHTYGH